MLVIRDKQIEALEHGVFIGWLGKHLLKFFPERCGELGAEGVARAMADGIARARSYGFREQGDLSRYMDVAFALGPGFDRDAALPWVREHLVAGANDNPTERMNALVAAVESRENARGAGGAS